MIDNRNTIYNYNREKKKRDVVNYVSTIEILLFMNYQIRTI